MYGVILIVGVAMSVGCAFAQNESTPLFIFAMGLSGVVGCAVAINLLAKPTDTIADRSNSLLFAIFTFMTTFVCVCVARYALGWYWWIGLAVSVPGTIGLARLDHIPSRQLSHQEMARRRQRQNERYERRKRKRLRA